MVQKQPERVPAQHHLQRADRHPSRSVQKHGQSPTAEAALFSQQNIPDRSQRVARPQRGRHLQAERQQAGGDTRQHFRQQNNQKRRGQHEQTQVLPRQALREQAGRPRLPREPLRVRLSEEGARVRREEQHSDPLSGHHLRRQAARSECRV